MLILRHRSIQIFVFLFLYHSLGHSDTVDKINLSECSVLKIISAEQIDISNRQGEIARNKIPLLDEQIRISRKAPNKTMPIGKQLSPSDLVKFEEVRQKLIQLSVSSIVNSARDRDLTLLERMTILADSAYRWRTYPNKDTVDSKLLMYVFVLGDLQGKNLSATEPLDTSKCNLDFALSKIEKEPLARMSELMPEINKMGQYIDSLKRKYQVTEITGSQLSQDELKFISEFNHGVSETYQDQVTFISMLEAIRVLARASLVMHKNYQYDVSVGSELLSTTRRKISEKTYDELTIKAINALMLIDKEFKSDDIKTMESIKKMIEGYEGRRNLM